MITWILFLFGALVAQIEIIIRRKGEVSAGTKSMFFLTGWTLTILSLVYLFGVR